MKSFKVAICIIAHLILLFVSSASSQRQQYLFRIPYKQLRECHFAEDSCATCWKQCPKARIPFFGSNRGVATHEDLVTSTQECIRHTTYFRKWLPEWCINDQRGFYSTKDFSPSPDACLLRPIACSQYLTKTSGSDPKKKELSISIANLGRAKQSLSDEQNEIADNKRKASFVAKAWKEQWLDEAQFHLENHREQVTKFSDPIFLNYTNMKAQNIQMTQKIKENNVAKAVADNQHVKRDTVEKIPQFLKMIKALKNHIHSKKKETNVYLVQIKQLAVKTADYQKKATNILFETSYATTLDGEIEVLDKELIELYGELKKERALLSELHVRSTFSKLRIVGVLRRMIQYISEVQRKNKCPASEVMAP